MKLPPRWLRHLLFGPALVVVTVTLIAALPVWVILLVFAAPFLPARRWRPLRLTWFGLVWLAFESVVLVALFVLWVASGFGWAMRKEWCQSAHYALIGWFLSHVVSTARRIFGLTFEVEWSGADDIEGRPLLVFARHAGPGDSLLLVDAVRNILGRRPRIVLKEALQWDPAIDVALNRLPNRFVSSGTGSVDAIFELASTMDGDDALVIFPEGGNFTQGRRLRAIERLHTSGRTELARRAGELEFLLPPKVGGVLAAVSGAPSAVVGLVGHVGLDHMETPLDVWAGMAMDRLVSTRVWLVEAQTLPAERDALETWLFDAWEEMDTWITSKRQA